MEKELVGVQLAFYYFCLSRSMLRFLLRYSIAAPRNFATYNIILNITASNATHSNYFITNCFNSLYLRLAILLLRISVVRADL